MCWVTINSFLAIKPHFFLPQTSTIKCECRSYSCRKNVILSCEWLHEVWENVCVLDNKPRCNLKTFTVVTLCHRLIFPLLVIKTISWYNKGICRVMWEKMGIISEVKKTALIHPVCITKLTWDLAQNPVVFMLSCQVIGLWALTVSIWFLRNSQGKCWKKNRLT